MWWILTQFSTSLTWHSATIYAQTSQDDHVFVAWSYYKPARTPVYRRRRGTNILCGYKYKWDTPNIEEQIQLGDTQGHTFHLVDLIPDSTIWFYLFAPDGPYGRQIQGPLMHLKLPSVAPSWTEQVFFASRSKGIYKTQDFTAPNPTWITDHGTLGDAGHLGIRQACPDPCDPFHRRFAIAGGQVYRFANVTMDDPAVATLVLTPAKARELTGSASGSFAWVEGNPWWPGYFYVLFNSALTDNGTWVLRTFDYGFSWQAYQIYNGLWNYRAGNIMCALLRGTSPYEQGTVLYATLNAGIGGAFRIYLSTNNGFSWSLRDTKGISIGYPRCLVDPTDQGVVYMGAFRNIGNPAELFRSMDHGAGMVEVDLGFHLGIFTDPSKGVMWIDPAHHNHAKVNQSQGIWTTDDECFTWSTPGFMPVFAPRLTIQPAYPERLYLARSANAPGFPAPGGWHVLFTSEDRGLTMLGKSGRHCDEADGGSDSLPFNCGGAAMTGIMPLKS